MTQENAVNRRGFMQSIAGVLGAICAVPSLMLGRRRSGQFDHDMKTLDQRIRTGIAGEELKSGELLIFGSDHTLYKYQHSPEQLTSVFVHSPERPCGP